MAQATPKVMPKTFWQKFITNKAIIASYNSENVRLRIDIENLKKKIKISNLIKATEAQNLYFGFL